uniref:SEA domain-containing protein n=1 Tax=Panagrolaimus sp. PS1159 TaxID=55785 RepID=A0AC35FVX6_9BILA
MAISASAAMALIAIIYRITINLPDMPFSPNLKNKTSTDFIDSSQQVMDAINFLIQPIPGFHNVTVKEFRYQQVVGTMVIMDILSTNIHDIESFKKLFQDSIQEGHIGWLAVAPEGFELLTMKGFSFSNFSFR